MLWESTHLRKTTIYRTSSVLFFALEEDTMNSSPTGEGESMADESKTLHALYLSSQTKHSLRKQRTFRDVTTNFLSKWRLKNERRNSVLMTCHYRNLGSASNWLKHISLTARPITSTLKILLVVPHQYGISQGSSSGVISQGNVFSRAN